VILNSKRLKIDANNITMDIYVFNPKFPLKTELPSALQSKILCILEVRCIHYLPKPSNCPLRGFRAGSYFMEKGESKP
jgi:hypothetical protein